MQRPIKEAASTSHQHRTLSLAVAHVGLHLPRRRTFFTLARWLGLELSEGIVSVL